jgi:hypothetical protein
MPVIGPDEFAWINSINVHKYPKRTILMAMVELRKLKYKNVT